MKLRSLQVEQSLVLKPLTEAEAPVLCQLIELNRSYLREWLPWLDSNLTESDSLSFIKSTQQDAEKGSAFVFGVYLSEKLVGIASLQGINQANRLAGIGYWIGQEFGGRGLARKAAAALVKYGFEEHGLNRIEIRCATKNTKSQRVPEALGFKFEGVLRQAEWLYDHFVDHRVYSILRNEHH